MSTVVPVSISKNCAHRLEGSRSSGGWSIFEVMMVLLISSILLAIVIPTYNGIRNNQFDHRAWQRLTVAQRDARGHTSWVQEQSDTDPFAQAIDTSMFPAVDPSSWSTPDFDYVLDESTSEFTISAHNVDAAPGYQLMFAIQSTSGNCIAMLDDLNAVSLAYLKFKTLPGTPCDSSTIPVNTVINARP